MKVKKRNGKYVDINYHKITQHVEQLYNKSPKLSEFIDPALISQKTITGLYDGVSTIEINELLSENAATLVSKHPEYSNLASRILIASLHKNTPKTFLDCLNILYNNKDSKTGDHAPLVSKKLVKDSIQIQEVIDSVINPDLDYQIEYFGIKTLYRSYLMRSNNVIIETPQYMYMRVAIGIHGTDIDNVIRTYQKLSEGWFTHATPTLFNSGTPKPQMSSCFLLTMKEDSIEGIYRTLSDCAAISQTAGGIGLSIHDIRATGSYIKGTGGVSNGIVPMLKVFNETARYVDQGGGKRKGSFAIYIEPWHYDIFDFLDLKKNTGKEELRARDLFPALWIPDLFMERVETNGDWTLMCPNECPGLSDVHSEVFNELYTKYESEGKGRKTIKAQDLWLKILESQIETGTPYMLYKDAANAKSNQQNLGTIKSSNLCTEIIEFSSPDEIAVCNLASIALPKHIINGAFCFEALYDSTYQATVNLDIIIDENHYPTPETKVSNMMHRPIGLGVQGLADTCAILEIAFDSDEAKRLNDDIFETMYYAALSASIERASTKGSYESYKESPASKGILQYDLWNKTDEVENKEIYTYSKGFKSTKWNWKALKAGLSKFGLRNSLLMAPMPTASTAQILGNNECFEAFTSNLYTRRTLSGDFIVINKHLVKKLIELDLWNDKIVNKLKEENGSVQNIPEIPTEVKEVYKTVWEISQKKVLEMAADRGKYICQSQSMNIFMDNANFGKLTSMHFHGWKLGLKTGMYYLRTRAAVDAIKFTVEKEQQQEQISCSLDDPDGCEACGA